MPAIVLCALAAHAAVYGTFAPEASGHAYFGWYAPAVTALSTVSLVLLPLAFAASVGAAPIRVRRAARRLLAGRAADLGGTRRRAASLAVGSFGFLVVQETLERSFSTNTFSLPHFGASTWLLLVAAVATAAGLVTLVGRAVDGLVAGLIGLSPRRRSLASAGVRPRLAARTCRPRPLAIHGALRAPPLLP
jgi:hypothetical protein